MTLRSHTSDIWIFEVIFVVCRLLKKNNIFNKTESFVGRNTSNHACQILCSKSNCENMYYWFFLLEITVVKKKMKNVIACSAHCYLYQRSRFKILLPWICVTLADYMLCLSPDIAIAYYFCCRTKGMWRYYSHTWRSIYNISKIMWWTSTCLLYNGTE